MKPEDTAFGRMIQSDSPKNEQDLAQKIETVYQLLLTNMATLEQLNTDIKDIKSNLTSLLSLLQRNTSLSTDIGISLNNLGNDIEDVRGTARTLVEKVDGVDMSIKSVPLYRHFDAQYKSDELI